MNSTNVITKTASWPTYKPAAQMLMIQGRCRGFFALFGAVGLTCGLWVCCSFWSHGSAGGVRPKLLWGPKPKGKIFLFIYFHIFSISLQLTDSVFFKSDNCPSLWTDVLDPSTKKKTSMSLKCIFLSDSWRHFSPILGHRCHCCSDQRHLRVQPAGRGPWSVHQPNGLHLCRVPAGRGGGGSERRPTGLHPYWHEQTLWWAASCNKPMMWLAHGKDECVCWSFRRASSDWSAGRLSVYPRPECFHGWLCQLCQYFWKETRRDASHSRWDDEIWL